MDLLVSFFIYCCCLLQQLVVYIEHIFSSSPKFALRLFCELTKLLVKQVYEEAEPQSTTNTN